MKENDASVFYLVPILKSNTTNRTYNMHGYRYICLGYTYAHTKKGLYSEREKNTFRYTLDYFCHETE